MKVSVENKAKVKKLIAGINEEVYEYYDGRPFELMVYEKCPDNEFDLSDFCSFKFSELEKVVKSIIKTYGKDLYCIDFKWSEVEGDFSQFTIYHTEY